MPTMVAGVPNPPSSTGVMRYRLHHKSHKLLKTWYSMFVVPIARMFLFENTVLNVDATVFLPGTIP